MRSGSSPLRVEQGRWKGELLCNRKCQLCVTGEVETEKHFLLECWVLDKERSSLFRNILLETGFDLLRMNDDTQWQLEVLLGVGFVEKQSRLVTYQLVGEFLIVA